MTKLFFQCCFVAWKGGLPRKLDLLCFVIINSVALNPLRVRIVWNGLLIFQHYARLHHADNTDHDSVVPPGHGSSQWNAFLTFQYNAS